MLDLDSRELEGFEAFADSVDELVFVWTTSGDLLWANQAFERETGLKADDFGFKNTENPFVYPDDLEHVVRELDAFLGSPDEHSKPIENRFIDAWGRERPISSIVHKIRWQDTPALLLVSTLTNPTGVRESDASYRSLVESADDGILKLAPDSRIVYANRRFQDMCGLGMVELARRHLSDLLLPNHGTDAGAALQRLQAGESRVSFEARLKRDGEDLWLHINVSPIDDTGDAATLLAIARDVSHTHRLEERVRQGQKLESLGTLAGGIAHDFNNIVTSVLANATLAETMLQNLGSGILDVVHDIRVAAERAAALNSSLLAYIGQAPAAFETLDLHASARETLAMLRPLVDPAVRLELSEAGDPPFVQADPSQLTQIMVNLITNGAEAVAQGGGQVQVETGVGHYPGGAGQAWLPSAPKTGRYAFIRVTDDGSGVPRSVLERIFDPFFSTKATGRGLGLSATLGIVKRHGGALCIDSEPGIGTRIDVILPIAERKPEKPLSSRPAPAATLVNTGVVLFCDDEKLIRQLAKRILEREGYEVVLAATGEEALEYLTANCQRYSVLVVDHSLPGIRGDKVAVRARELKPNLAIVKASGYRDVFDEKDVGSSVFLPKPFTRSALLDSLLAAMRAAPRTT